MRKPMWKLAGVAMAGLMGMSASGLKASPIVNLTLLGNTDGSANYTSVVSVKPGDTVHFEVVAEMAPVGTVNTQLGTASPVTSETGVNTIKFNLLGSVGGVAGTWGTRTLATGWGDATGTGVGTVSGSDVTNVFAGRSAGSFAAVNGAASVLLTGQFTVASATSGSALSLGKYATMGGSFKINGSVTKFITNTTEANADPYVGYTGLTLSVPEPASLGLLGLGSLGLLRRKRMGR